MADINWHIEATSKCTLECPLCDRTWFYEKFKKREIHEIDIEMLKNFLGEEAEVTFCGNNGDPIYHSRFLELCEELKKQNTRISITTNGSGKSHTWWEKLCGILDSGDKVTFSIDGLEDTNHIYRKNAKWKTIMTGIEVCTRHLVKVVWKFIMFKHNQHQIQEVKKLAKELGIDEVKVIQSDRWHDLQYLMPDDKHVDQNYVYKENVRKDLKEYKAKMNPVCMVNKKPANELYIDSAGNFYPCCFQGGYHWRHQDIFDPRLTKFNIKDNTVESILSNLDVKRFFNDIFNYEKVNKCCKINCGVING